MPVDPRAAQAALHFAFTGISRPVAIIDAVPVAECLPTVFRNWPFEQLQDIAEQPIITIRRIRGAYEVVSPNRSPPPRYRSPVDAVCTLVADLVHAVIDEDKSLLCLHCAAVEVAGRLVVFPDTYRAGKSTFATQLAAAGMRLFGDDVLPIRLDSGVGVAAGIAPRLRLPLPDGSSDTFRRFVDAHHGPANKRYEYLDLGDARLAHHGDAAPVGAFVRLRRRPNASATLTPMDDSDMLRHVIPRNFARGAAAVDTIDRLHDLVAGAQCYELSYNDGAAGAAMLLDNLSNWPAPETPTELVRPTAPVTSDQRGTGRGLVRDSAAVARAVGDDLYVAVPASEAIFHLNPVGAALWCLLAEPTDRNEAVEIVRLAFPHVPAEQITRDVTKLLGDLAACGLITEITED